MTPELPDLPVIGLADLARDAGLLTRIDRKYVLTTAQADRVLAGLPGGTRILQIGGRREFGYRSTYFDTSRLEAFAATATSRRRRWKVRTRTYADIGDCWLEVKTRGPRGSTVKTRIAHPAARDTVLDDRALRFVAGELARLGGDEAASAMARALRPVLVSTYRRAAFLAPDAASRATLDWDLGWHGAGGLTRDSPDVVILETKSPSAASALDRRLWSLGHRPARMSKFGAGLVLLDPALNHHRWNRLVGADGPLTR